MFEHRPPIERNLCFVLMPFKEALKPVYDKINEIAVVKHNLSCVRADDIYSAGIIIEEIWTWICKSQLIIADVTEKNPNVLYEMGLAHALEKPVIMISQTIGDIPFDLQHRRIILYKLEKLEELGIRLSNAIESAKWKPPEIKEWIKTNNSTINLGLSKPTNKTVVNQIIIEAVGQVIGLDTSNPSIRYYIQAFVETDKIYEQMCGWIDNEGYWKIQQIHMGAMKHKIFFKIFNQFNRVIAHSEPILLTYYSSS